MVIITVTRNIENEKLVIYEVTGWRKNSQLLLVHLLVPVNTAQREPSLGRSSDGVRPISLLVSWGTRYSAHSWCSFYILPDAS